jgi:hypothetical protein
MFYDQVMDYAGPGIAGPFSAGAVVLPSVGFPPAEGVWAFSGASKVASIEVFGTLVTGFSGQVWGSNQLGPPMNQYVVTFAGSPAVSNTIALTFNNPNLSGGTRTVNYTLAANPTATIVAAAVAGLINADVNFTAIGFSATNVAGVLTVAYPSVPQASTSSSPGTANATTLSAAVTGGGVTATVAVGANGVALGSAISTLGLTSVSVIPRWVTFRLTALTGSPPLIGANFNGAC